MMAVRSWLGCVFYPASVVRAFAPRRGSALPLVRSFFVSGHFKLNHKVPRLLADQNAERQKPKQFTGDNLNRPGIVSGSNS